MIGDDVIGDEVIGTLYTGDARVAMPIEVLEGSFERRAMDVASCELEISILNEDWRYSPYMDILTVALYDRCEHFIIIAIERRNTYWIMRGESVLRYARDYYPDRYAGTSDAQWNGDAAAGVIQSLRHTEYRGTHAFISGFLEYNLIVPDATAPSINVSCAFAWASRLEAAQEITRLAHAQGYPLIWWYECAVRGTPVAGLCFSHAMPRHGIRRIRHTLAHDAYIADRSNPPAGIALGYGHGVDRDMTRASLARARFSAWSYWEGRTDGRASGTSAAMITALMRWRPVYAGGGQSYSDTRPRLGDQVYIVGGEPQIYAGTAWVVAESYRVQSGRIADVSYGVVQI